MQAAVNYHSLRRCFPRCLSMIDWIPWVGHSYGPTHSLVSYSLPCQLLACELMLPTWLLADWVSRISTGIASHALSPKDHVAGA
jgi:hypothetical protein